MVVPSCRVVVLGRHLLKQSRGTSSACGGLVSLGWGSWCACGAWWQCLGGRMWVSPTESGGGAGDLGGGSLGGGGGPVGRVVIG